MSILLYLLKSAIILGVLFLFYRVFLEKEKMHQFNRAYLLFAIVFSFVVPILPTGIQFMELTTAAGNGFNQRFSMIPSADTTTEEIGIGFHFGWLLWTMYAVVFSYFGHQFIKSIRELIQVKKDYNHHEINGISIVLMDKEISPFTFMNWIYINKKEYEEKKIDPQLIDHELVHALEKHSWDVIFIEALITIFWFNPILRAYKKAIQLNHEFLADDSVLKKYNKVQSYQHLLLDTIENNTMISLASNINFHLTQKRLKMMTKHSSLKRKRILVLSTVPLMIGMLLCFGNPAVSQGENTFTHETQESIDPDEYYKNAIIHFLQKDGKVKVVPYAKLSDSEKAKVPPPPPPPPTTPGEKRTKMKMKALSEGAIVKVTEDGNVFVNANRDMAIPKPPKPPKPPNAPKPEKNPKLNKAPKPPKAPNAVLPPPPPPPVKDTWKAKSLKANSQVLAPPPPPPPPVSMEELIKEGADIYIDGKKATDEEVRALSKNDMEDIETIEVIVDKKGKKSLYIKRK